MLENSQVREYSTYRFIFGFFLRLRKSTFQKKKTKKTTQNKEKKKDLWCTDEAFRIIFLQRQALL